MKVVTVKKILQKEVAPGYKARFIHSKNMTFVYWDVKKGALLPEHSHPHEQVAHMIKGKFKITVEGKSRVLQPGSVLIIPSNAKHSGKALTNCQIIDVFYPIREDYKK